MTAPGETVDRFESERQRRRHPVERRTSRWSGLLLLLVIPHAAFGYSLVALAPEAQWVRNVHFLVAPIVLVLSGLLLRSALGLPWRRLRERALVALSWLVVLLATFQLLSGSWMRWGLPGSGGLWIVHIGSGILNTIAVAVVHVVAILPSILLSARREHAELTGSRRP